ncbi:type II secretion system inner membrane protein GspF [Gallaecimonas kandeliae]|uniref:type II secretion system inner membrane protein GspF n=1 Tax=Gallaecimonas kandeliae TaxID=3029055 RepID=UPI002649BBA3|nr:type II secretion system inner membrane protein GspF [Gallaecimonas kandeliae]WKE65916.1 type II secretion system inner membrane protein GspF [Gallaecimonas kandeliae]
MAAFEYVALDAKGKQKKGILEADSPRAARNALREQGLMPVTLEASVQKEKAQGKSRGFGSSRRISVPDLALITRQLSTLVQSALPLEECLKAVAEQTEKPRLKRILMAVRSKVVEGYTLADSMGEFPHVFDELFCAMVSAGEKSGHLDTVLNRLADYTEQRQVVKQQVQQAMIYPIILTLVAIGVITMLLTTVVPQVVGQFEHMKATLPATTRFLIAASDFIRHWGLLILAGFIVALVGFNRAMQGAAFRKKVHGVWMRMPVLGKVVRGINTARFARTLSICSASAVPLLEGMRISGEVLTNNVMQEAVAEATTRVREGASLRQALTQTKLFPPMMLHMIASGEKSGELTQMLERAADNQDREFSNLVTVALGILTPTMVVAMAGIVFFIVISILQPILEMNNMVA